MRTLGGKNRVGSDTGSEGGSSRNPIAAHAIDHV